MYTISLLSLFLFASLTTWLIVDHVFDRVIRRRIHVDRRLHEAFLARVRNQAKSSALFRNLGEPETAAHARLPALLAYVQGIVEQSGTKFTAAQIVSAVPLCGLAAAFAVYTIFTSVLLATVAAALMVMMPVSYIVMCRQRRRTQLQRQLPEAFDAMSRSLRSGQAVSAAFQHVSEEFPSPIADEFALCFEQQQLGVPFDASVRDLARRTAFVEAHIFAASLIINRRVGGDLAEVLGQLSATMRKRDYFQRRIKALTGEGRLQAVVLIGLPFVALLALHVLNPSYAEVLFSRPRLLAVTCAAQLAGAGCIHHILKLDF